MQQMSAFDKDSFVAESDAGGGMSQWTPAAVEESSVPPSAGSCVPNGKRASLASGRWSLSTAGVRGGRGRWKGSAPGELGIESGGAAVGADVVKPPTTRKRRPRGRGALHHILSVAAERKRRGRGSGGYVDCLIPNGGSVATGGTTEGDDNYYNSRSSMVLSSATTGRNASSPPPSLSPYDFTTCGQNLERPNYTNSSRGGTRVLSAADSSHHQLLVSQSPLLRAGLRTNEGGWLVALPSAADSRLVVTSGSNQPGVAVGGGAASFPSEQQQQQHEASSRASVPPHAAPASAVMMESRNGDAPLACLSSPPSTSLLEDTSRSIMAALSNEIPNGAWGDVATRRLLSSSVESESGISPLMTTSGDSGIRRPPSFSPELLAKVRELVSAIKRASRTTFVSPSTTTASTADAAPPQQQRNKISTTASDYWQMSSSAAAVKRSLPRSGRRRRDDNHMHAAALGAAAVDSSYFPLATELRSSRDSANYMQQSGGGSRRAKRHQLAPAGGSRSSRIPLSAYSPLTSVQTTQQQLQSPGASYTLQDGYKVHSRRLRETVGRDSTESADTGRAVPRDSFITAPLDDASTGMGRLSVLRSVQRARRRLALSAPFAMEGDSEQPLQLSVSSSTAACGQHRTGRRGSSLQSSGSSVSAYSPVVTDQEEAMGLINNPPFGFQPFKGDYKHPRNFLPSPHDGIHPTAEGGSSSEVELVRCIGELNGVAYDEARDSWWVQLSDLPVNPDWRLRYADLCFNSSAWGGFAVAKFAALWLRLYAFPEEVEKCPVWILEDLESFIETFFKPRGVYVENFFNCKLPTVRQSKMRWPSGLTASSRPLTEGSPATATTESQVPSEKFLQ